MARISGANLIGSFPVLDTRNSVNYYLQNAQKQQAKRDAEMKALQEDLAKPKIDGIREPDRKEYIEKYNDFKDTFRQIQAEKDPTKKAILKSEFSKKELDLQELIADSKALAKGEIALSTIMMDPVKRDNFADDAVDVFQKSKTLPRRDPKYVRDLTNFERKLDLSKVDEDLKKVDDYLKNNSKWSNPVEKAGKQGNRQGVYVSQSRAVDPLNQAKEYTNQAAINPNFRLFLKNQFPNMPQQDAIAALVAQRPVREDKAPEFKENDNWKVKKDYDDSLIRRRKADGITGSGGDEEVYYRNQWMNDMLSGVPGSGEKLQQMLKARGGYTKQNPVEFDTRDPNKLVIKVAEREIPKSRRDASGKVVTESEIISPMTVTIDRNDPAAKTKFNQILNDITGEKISESKIRTNQASGKIKGQSTTQPAKKTISKSAVASKASAAGYSVAEYTKLLKANGVEIK